MDQMQIQRPADGIYSNERIVSMLWRGRIREIDFPKPEKPGAKLSNSLAMLSERCTAFGE